MKEERTISEEANEIPEVPWKSRKTLVTVSLIAIVLVSSGVLIWSYTQTADVHTPQEGSILYSQYDISFEYPEGMEMSEYGDCSSSFGIIRGLLIDDEIELIHVGWAWYMGIEVERTMSGMFTDMEMVEGFQIERGQLTNSITSTDCMHPMKRQNFTAPHFPIHYLTEYPEPLDISETAYGMCGVWHCTTRDMVFFFMLTYSRHNVLPKFQEYLNSFCCHD